MGKLVIDKLAGPLIHGHREDQISGLEEKYVEVAGDTMTGALVMGTNPIRLQDTSGVNWDLTIGTDGALITTAVTAPLQGNPIGLGLLFTYAEDQ